MVRVFIMISVIGSSQYQSIKVKKSYFQAGYILKVIVGKTVWKLKLENDWKGTFCLGVLDEHMGCGQSVKIEFLLYSLIFGR